jgi:hypothetical protein
MMITITPTIAVELAAAVERFTTLREAGTSAELTIQQGELVFGVDQLYARGVVAELFRKPLKMSRSTFMQLSTIGKNADRLRGVLDRLPSSSQTLSTLATLPAADFGALVASGGSRTTESD